MRDPQNYTRGLIPDDRLEIHRAGVSDPVVVPRFGGSADIGPTGSVETVVDSQLAIHPVRDQGLTQGCTRHAITGGLERWEAKELGRPVSYQSPPFLIYVDDPPNRGRNLGQAIFVSAAAAARYGVCSDAMFPLVVKGQRPEDRINIVPDREAFIEAERHQVTGHYRIEDGDVAGVHNGLVRGHDVVFGLLLREGFYSRTGVDGIVKNTGDPVGWHAMLCVGFVSIQGTLYAAVRNSYGTDFGYHGYVYLTLAEMERARDLRVFTNLEVPTR